MAQKPAIPKGTRDFLPREVARRTYIFDTIKSVFKTYGFAPIETPSFELSETLMGKYGEEGDRLIFRILNSGEYLSKSEEKITANHALETALNKTFVDLAKRLARKDNQKPFDSSKYFLNEFNKNFKISGHNIRTESSFERIKKANGSFLKTRSLDEVLDRNSRTLNESKTMNYIDGLKRNLKADIVSIQSKDLNPIISGKALRYDLTVPFARFVVQHQNDLSFPFKRYQIQPVWRADRPQHGRYQEFFQCDADVVGSDSLLYEIDFVQIFDQVLTRLGIPGFTIKINNRKILSGIAEVSGEAEKLVYITVAIDKLDKVGKEGVVKELREKGVSEKAIEIIAPLFQLSGTDAEKLASMKTFLASSEIGLKGIEELETVLNATADLGLERAVVEFDVTLARGLNYYTGAIFEVKVHDVKMGSICGGGRYDDLTGLFGLKGMSGVGISFGADRIYDVLNELDLYPKETDAGLTLMLVNFGEKEAAYGMKLTKKLRAAGVDCEVYPSNAKMQKQMKYANDKGARFVALIGENELASGQLQVKNMETGEQQAYDEAGLISFFSSL